MPDMSDDAPLTRGEFRREFTQFQTRLFAHLSQTAAGVDTRLDRVDAQFVEVRGQIEGLAGGMDQLRTEYHMIVAGLFRVEGRLDAVEQRLDTLEAGQREILAAIAQLEERLSRVERRVEELAAHGDVLLRSEVAALRARLDRLEREVHERASREG